MELLIFGFIIVFSYVSAKYGMSNRIYMTSLAIGLLLLGIVFQLNEVYLLVVVIIGIVSFKSIARFMT
ncbi:MAG: hypothetical protein M0R17_06035 [Candidatus Omnitrophica bacterium]|nr:hypothetical protein [Candidatus Omnitrophota bacterium]